MVYKTCSDARYFVGVDIQSHALQMCAMDLSGNVITEGECLDFVYSNTPPLHGRNVQQNPFFHKQSRN